MASVSFLYCFFSYIVSTLTLPTVREEIVDPDHGSFKMHDWLRALPTQSIQHPEMPYLQCLREIYLKSCLEVLCCYHFWCHSLSTNDILDTTNG